MNIVFITHDIDSGGSARSLAVLVQKLYTRHNITIITFWPPDPSRAIATLYKELNISLYCFNWGWLPVSFVGVPYSEHHEEIFKRQRQYLSDVKDIAASADVVCFNSYAPSSLAPYFPGKRKILFAREIIEKTIYPDYTKSVSMLKRYIDMAIAIGPREATQLQEFGIPCSIVYNSSPITPSFTPLPTFPPVHFGMFSQFTPLKGLDIILLACASQAKTLQAYNTHVHLFGVGARPSSVQAFLQAYELTECVHLEGWVDNVQVNMKNMHCMIRPDRTGSPWGRDIIEAMSIGRSVLASGDEDVFIKNGQTGYLFPPGDVAILGKIIRLVAQEPTTLETMGRNAFTFAQEHFDPEKNALRIEHILMGDNPV